MGAERISPDARRWMASALGLAALIGLALAVALPVPDSRAALVLRFGQPVRVIDGAGGLALRWPLVERVVWLDRRLQAAEVDNATVTTRDGQPLAIDAYANWRVTDPLRFYQALGTPDRADDTLRAILASVLRQEIGRSRLTPSALARGEDDGALRAAFKRELAGYGATVIDLRLSRVALPEGAPLEAAYARMTASADADAAAVTAEGHRNAQLIRADAEVRAGEIYAASFGKDPQFYDFYRAMESYDATFAQKGSKTTIVLSPDNLWLRQFRGK
jgi:membrane protease subunit HflC